MGFHILEHSEHSSVSALPLDSLESIHPHPRSDLSFGHLRVNGLPVLQHLPSSFQLAFLFQESEWQLHLVVMPIECDAAQFQPSSEVRTYFTVQGLLLRLAPHTPRVATGFWAEFHGGTAMLETSNELSQNLYFSVLKWSVRVCMT